MAKKKTRKKSGSRSPRRVRGDEAIREHAGALARGRVVPKAEVGRAVQALIDFDNATELRVSKMSANAYQIVVEQFN